MNEIKIGLAQLLVEGGEPKRNIKRAEILIRQAANENCDLVLLPEALDFAWTHPSALKESKAIPGPFSDQFCDLARELKLALCLGLTEKSGDQNYNTALLIDENGEIKLKYRKINLLEVEFPYYQIGQKLEVVDMPWGKMGVNICSDNYIDSLDIGRCLARMGAQIILSPSSWTVDHSVTEEDHPYQEKWLTPFHYLAKTFNLSIVSATSVGYIVGGPYEGKKMVGCSLAVGPQGPIAIGQFNEFAGELTCIQLPIYGSELRGTQFGELLGAQNL
jgi:predicted amidohydrolase